MRHHLQKNIDPNEIVVISKPGEEYMWREMTPEEKMARKLKLEGGDPKAGEVFSNIIKTANNFD